MTLASRKEHGVGRTRSFWNILGNKRNQGRRRSHTSTRSWNSSRINRTEATIHEHVRAEGNTRTHTITSRAGSWQLSIWDPKSREVLSRMEVNERIPKKQKSSHL